MFLSKYADTQASLIQHCWDILHLYWGQPACLLQPKSAGQRSQVSHPWLCLSNVKTRWRMTLIYSPVIKLLHQWEMNHSLAVPIMPSAHPEDNFCENCLYQPRTAVPALPRQGTFLQSTCSPFLPTAPTQTTYPKGTGWVRAEQRISNPWVRHLHVSVQ